MTAGKRDAREQDWTKAMYKALDLDFPADDAIPGKSGAPVKTGARKAQLNERSPSRQSAAAADLDDYVLVDEPVVSDPKAAKVNPLQKVMADLGLKRDDAFAERLNAYQTQLDGLAADPKKAASADPKAKALEQNVKRVLTLPQEEADLLLQERLKKNLRTEARTLTKDLIMAQAGDPVFTGFLEKAATAPPHSIDRAQRETLVFLGQNLQDLSYDLVEDARDRAKDNAFAADVTKELVSARANAVTKKEHQQLDALEEKLDAFQWTLARQLGPALNTANDIETADSFGKTAESTAAALLQQAPKTDAAVADIRKLADNAVRKHLAKSNDAKLTQNWAAQQPWGSLIDVTIQANGRYFDINVKPRQSSLSQSRGKGTAQSAEVIAQPDMVFGGLRSEQMMQALSSRPTKEAAKGGPPFVERPSDFALNWGQSLAGDEKARKAFEEKMPDYLQLKQVRYHEMKKGIFKTKDVVKTAWVVEQKPVSDSIEGVNLLRQLPGNIARNLADLSQNIADLQRRQAENMAEIVEQKKELKAFMDSQGDGILKSYGKAHDAMTGLKALIMQETKKCLLKGMSVKKIYDWADKQPWAAMFDMDLEPDEGGNYLIHVVDKKHSKRRGLHGVGASPRIYKDDEENRPVSGSDTSFEENKKTLNGALQALLSPMVYNKLVSRPLGKAENGVIVVEKPTKFAREWAELILKANGPEASLPDYLEIREVMYASETKQFWKRNKLKSCKVLEFIPGALKAEAAVK